MRTIERTTQFKRDFKREQRGRHQATLRGDLVAILEDLVSDRALAPKLRDHALTGNWKDHRDCHVNPISFLSIGWSVRRHFSSFALDRIPSSDFRRRPDRAKRGGRSTIGRLPSSRYLTAG